MVDYVSEISTKLFFKYGDCGSFEYLLFLFMPWEGLNEVSDDETLRSGMEGNGMGKAGIKEDLNPVYITQPGRLIVLLNVLLLPK